ncbi:unnamed protein product, partial [Didymodactylos carnosus]
DLVVVGRLFVGRVDPTINVEQLKEYFNKYGSIKKCVIDINGKYALIDFNNDKSIENILKLQENNKLYSIQGKYLHLNRTMNTSVPR